MKRKPILKKQAEHLLRTLQGWNLTNNAKEIVKVFVMKDFSSALDLINRILPIAEKQDHHPDLHLTGYRKLRIVLSTHDIGGLSKNDFVLAQKIEKLPKKLKTNTL